MTATFPKSALALVENIVISFGFQLTLLACDLADEFRQNSGQARQQIRWYGAAG